MAQRLAWRFRDQLEQDIVTGRYQPGERLDEVRLAARFSVSRTPVREALMHLASIGVVDLRPRRGAFVAQPEEGRLADMFELMAELECACGRHAASRIARAEREALQESHAACADAAERGDADAYYYENERFHHVIYAASHNRLLADQARTLRTRLKPYRRLQLRVPDRMARSLAEHGEIMNAVLMGDARRAERALRAHILVQSRSFADYVAGLDARARRAG